MKALQVVQSAYRCNIEEQDDPVVWITHAMKGAGAELDVLLRGNAVNYAVTGQDATGITFGSWEQTQPPRIEDDVASLIRKGVDVYVVAEDAAERGIQSAALIDGVRSVSRGAVSRLFEAHDQVWHW